MQNATDTDPLVIDEKGLVKSWSSGATAVASIMTGRIVLAKEYK